MGSPNTCIDLYRTTQFLYMCVVKHFTTLHALELDRSHVIFQGSLDLMDTSILLTFNKKNF